MEEDLSVKWSSFSLFDYIKGTGEFLNIETIIRDNTAFTLLLLITIVIILIWAVIRLAVHKIFPPAGPPLIVLTGFITGKIIHSLDTDQQYDHPSQLVGMLAVQSTVALYAFHCTESMDYHTLNRNIFHIISIGIVYAILSLVIIIPIGYVMMNPAFGWTVHETSLLVLALMTVEVEHTIHVLKEARGQIRRLMQILMGERLVTMCIASTLTPGLSSPKDPHIDDPNGTKHVIRFIIWSLIKTPILAVAFFIVCKWLSIKTASNHVAQVMLTVPITVGIFSFSLLLGTSQTMTVVIFGILMNSTRAQMLGQKERFINYFWQFLNFIAESMLYFFTGVMAGVSQLPDLGVMDLGFILAFFILNLFTRAITYMIMNQMFMKFGMQALPWSQAALAIFGGYKGRPNIYLAALPLYRDENVTRGFIYMLIIVLLSWFSGITLISSVLYVLGFYDLDRSAIVNMNMATLQVNNCRTKAIFALKMDRFISDANWGVVDWITHLSHPYKKQLKSKLSDTDFGEVFQTKTIACSDCGKETLTPLTKKQLEDLRLEAKLRILKAQLVSFMKQHESGTLSEYGFRLLSNLAEVASLREDPTMDSTEVKIQRGTKFLFCLRSSLLLAQKWTSYSYDFVPRNRLRYFCYCLSTSLTFQVIMAFLAMVDLAIIMSMVVHWKKNGPDSNGLTMNWTQGISIFFYFVYVLEFFIHILGLGIPQYFRRHVNKLEFGTSIVLRTCEVALYFHRCSNTRPILPFMDLEVADQAVIIHVKLFMIGRLSRVYIFLSAIIPKALSSVELQMDEVLLRNYDTGKAYLIGLERVGKFLTRITENEATYEELKKAVDQDRLKITKELSLVQKDYPKIAITVKTRHAVRHVVNEMTECVADMKEEGILDANETKFLLESIEELKDRHKRMSRVEPCPPDYIFKEIPWLRSEYNVINHLLKYAELMNYDYSDVIIQHGNDPVGLFVLVSGSVKSLYRPTSTTVQLSAKFGVLPNYDFFANVKMDQSQEEYVVAGNVIGETGAVTGRRYDMTVICETAAQVYYVPNDALKTVLFDWDVGESLQRNIWKTIGIRIAEILFQMESLFNDWSREALYSYLQRGVVLNLSQVTAIHNKNDLVDDIVLIEGAIMDVKSRTVYYGPYHLPRGIDKFLLPEHKSWDFQTVYETRLLIIPKTNIDEEDLISPLEGIFAEKRVRDKTSTTRVTTFASELPAEREPSITSSPHRTAHSHLRRRVGFTGGGSQSFSGPLTARKQPSEGSQSGDLT